VGAGAAAAGVCPDTETDKSRNNKIATILTLDSFFICEI
jgi:hypothetical protein